LRHDDDDYVDEVRIRTVERYKTSGLSGDEWRFSAVIQFFRKGQLLHERGLGDIKAALAYAPWALATAYEGDGWDYAKDENLCFQPGCTETAVSEYQLVDRFDHDGNKSQNKHSTYYRKFCQKHLTRGDCALEDADSNYILINGIGPDGTDWKGANITESARVEVRVDSLDDLPGALKDVAKEFGQQ